MDGKKAVIESARGQFVVRFGSEEPFVANSLRGMVEMVIGYFVPSREARRWRIEIDELPNETGETP